MVYRFKKGVRYRKECDPQQIGETLEQVRVSNDGRLQVQDVLVEAANPASALHPVFTWDDVEAAGHWREQEARQLIRSVVVTTSTEEDAEEVAAFWNVRIAASDDEQGDQYYQAINVLEQSPREYQAALVGLLGQIEGLDRSIKELRRVTPPSQIRQVDKAQGLFQRAKNILNP